MTILDRIVRAKREALVEAKVRRPIADLQRAAAQAPPPRDFYTAVATRAVDTPTLIAEIKKASPSAGVIVDDFDPVRIARIYEAHGAVALSVLTDEPFFQGSLEHLTAVRSAVSLPVLRKDFIIDEYQVVEARAAGADTVLLIVEVLGATGVAYLLDPIRSLGMTALVEVHSEATLHALTDRVGQPGPDTYLLGINNRDLSAQRTDVATTGRLAAALPPRSPFIAESGIATRADVEAVARAGACGMLVGESLLRAPDIGAKVDELLGREG